jgi:hypothetical protein
MPFGTTSKRRTVLIKIYFYVDMGMKRLNHMNFIIITFDYFQTQFLERQSNFLIKLLKNLFQSLQQFP